MKIVACLCVFIMAVLGIGAEQIVLHSLNDTADVQAANKVFIQSILANDANLNVNDLQYMADSASLSGLDKTGNLYPNIPPTNKLLEHIPTTHKLLEHIMIAFAEKSREYGTAPVLHNLRAAAVLIWLLAASKSSELDTQNVGLKTLNNFEKVLQDPHTTLEEIANNIPSLPLALFGNVKGVDFYSSAKKWLQQTNTSLSAFIKNGDKTPAHVVFPAPQGIENFTHISLKSLRDLAANFFNAPSFRLSSNEVTVEPIDQPNTFQAPAE